MVLADRLLQELLRFLFRESKVLYPNLYYLVAATQRRQRQHGIRSSGNDEVQLLGLRLDQGRRELLDRIIVDVVEVVECENARFRQLGNLIDQRCYDMLGGRRLGALDQLHGMRARMGEHGSVGDGITIWLSCVGRLLMDWLENDQGGMAAAYFALGLDDINFCVAIINLQSLDALPASNLSDLGDFRCLGCSPSL